MASERFTGIWVSKELLADERFTPTEKLMLAYWGSFGTREKPNRCFQSDETQAAALGVCPKTFSNKVSDLRKRGILKDRKFPFPWEVLRKGRNEKLRGKLPENGKSTSRKQEVALPENGNIDKRLEQRSEQTIGSGEPDARSSYGTAGKTLPSLAQTRAIALAWFEDGGSAPDGSTAQGWADDFHAALTDGRLIANDWRRCLLARLDKIASDRAGT